MGWNSQPTAVVTFEDCRVPVENRLGPEGDGFKFAMKGLDGGRINIAACSLGGAAWALDAAKAHVQERMAFGKPLSAQQAVQFKLADMATKLEASRLMTYRAAVALDAGDPDATMRSAMAKQFVTDACYDIVDEALQLHGGYGYIKEYGLELRLRDLRVHRILEGANEIMRLIVSRKLLEAA
jgi:alkylation response protein AidB-like acyl-CoA dehydrogenase